MLLLAFATVPQAFAQTSGAYRDITVDEAYKMIKKARGNLVILDVRNQSEYKLGHLYGAVLIPVYALEERISELQDYISTPIIVYCKAGSRSQTACEILASYGFTKVYNMLGGITAWIEAGYPIYTTYHYITVDVVGKHALISIEPLTLYQTSCASCGCHVWFQNQVYLNIDMPSNIKVTTIGRNENKTVTLITYEVDDAAYEVIVTQILLWSYNELTDEINRIARFVYIEIATEETSMQFYSLSYTVQHGEYNLTLLTTLTLLDSETYSSSFTVMNYAPAVKSELISLEFVEFNSSVTLSQLYAILGKVAKEVGKVYKKSECETLMHFAQGYCVMEKEAKYLSKLVQKQLREYDREILENSIAMIDPWWTCLPCVFGWTSTCILGAWALCLKCCAVFPPCCACMVWLTIFPLLDACMMIAEQWCIYLGLCP